MREPKWSTGMAAMLARRCPRLSPYAAAVLAEELGRIERAQHRHAERCCSGEDGGYVRYDAERKCRVHDPEAEERAGERIRRRLQRALRRFEVGAVRCELLGDPRGAVLTVEFPPVPAVDPIDRIAETLDGKEWTADTVQAIAEIVRSTGRKVGEVTP